MKSYKELLTLQNDVTSFEFHYYDMLGVNAVILSEKMVNPSQLTDDSMISFIDWSFDFLGKLFFEI